MGELKAIEKNEKSEALTMQASYKNLVEYGKVLIGRIERNQLELARLCYRANQEFGGQGKRNDLVFANLSTGGQVENIHTFRSFCSDIGISKSYGYKVIAAYNAAEDRLYTKEEMKEMVAEAWDSLCRDIHHRRTHGEPLWKPEKWNDTLEFRYEQWLEAHGYKPRMKVDPSILNDAGFFQTGYPSFGPFTFEFLDTVGHYCLAETSGENAIRYFNMCERWKSRLPSGVEPQKVFRIPVLVKGAIAQLPPESRKAATILVANILRDYVEGEV